MNLTTNKKYTLLIKIIDENMRSYYKDKLVNDGNAGYDLFLSNDIIIKPNKTYTQLGSGIKCEMIEEYFDINFDSINGLFGFNNCKVITNNVSYLLMPRSSITKYNLIMANSVGLIDASYRGEILGRVYNLNEENIEFKRGERLFQLVAPNLSSFNVKIVDELSETLRNEGGFGSTGK
jgi:dUTP pyrophosphatase